MVNLVYSLCLVAIKSLGLQVKNGTLPMAVAGVDCTCRNLIGSLCGSLHGSLCGSLMWFPMWFHECHKELVVAALRLRELLAAKNQLHRFDLYVPWHVAQLSGKGVVGWCGGPGWAKKLGFFGSAVRCLCVPGGEDDRWLCGRCIVCSGSYMSMAAMNSFPVNMHASL